MSTLSVMPFLSCPVLLCRAATARDRCKRFGRRRLVAPLRRDHTHTLHALDCVNHENAAAYRPPALAGPLHELPALLPFRRSGRRRMAAEGRHLYFEAEQ